MLGGTVIPRAVDQPFMSRDQTDEWKGWMQFLILIYHYTGASKILRIYEAIRVCVAAYLFMTGFGHTVFFYTKGDFSFQRFVSVLVRLNLLSCTLPYLMKTDYLFYYFAPLVSFWFVVVYLTMRIGQSKNGSLSFLICKIFTSSFITTAMTRAPGILECLFDLLQRLCHIRWDLKEWRFRVSLDMYVVHVGMLAGILYVRLKNALNNGTDRHAPAYIQHHFRTARVLSITSAVTILPLYWIIILSFPDKYAYNLWQPYIAPFPILAYIAIRNSNRHFRNFYSLGFAWLGRCSLETFTLQFHIWLAADTKGLLSIGSFRQGGDEVRILDFVILTPLFLWTSWHVATATSTLTAWIIDPRDRESGQSTKDASYNNNSALPIVKSHKILELREERPWLVRRNVVGQFFRLIRDDLRMRLGLIMLIMWLCNWVCSPFSNINDY